MDVNKKVKFFYEKFKKKYWGTGGCQGGFERRSEVFVKIQQNRIVRILCGSGGGGGGGFDPHSGRHVVTLSKMYLPPKKYWLYPGSGDSVPT